MKLVVTEDDFGALTPTTELPENWRPYLISPHQYWYLEGRRVRMLWQGFFPTRLPGCQAWYNRYEADHPTVLRARGPEDMLELRINWKDIIRGEWDRMAHTFLPEGCFSFSFAPYTLTRAVFDHPGVYETYDVHLTVETLLALGIDFQKLTTFLAAVNAGRPAELSAVPFRCPNGMLEAVRRLLRPDRIADPFGSVLLDNHLENILIYALQTVAEDQFSEPVLNASDIEAVHHARDLIVSHLPVYPGNDYLVAQARPQLNRLKLHYGFHRLFRTTPHRYYLFLRLEEGRRLLERGESVSVVAYTLEYHSATTFIRTFKEHYGLTPKQYQLRL